MSILKIIKGDPFSMLVGLSNDDTSVNLHSGTWTANVAITYQTKDGASPFSINLTPSGNSFLIELTGEQTALLSTKGAGYVLSVLVENHDDATIKLKNYVRVVVIDDL